MAQANDFDTFDARSMLGWERLLLLDTTNCVRARRATLLTESITASESASRVSSSWTSPLPA